MPITLAIRSGTGGVMHIVSSQVKANSQHLFEHTEQRVSLRQRLADSPPPPASPKPSTPPVSASAAPVSTDESADEEFNLETSLLKALVEAMTGRQIRTLGIAHATAAAANSATPAAAAPAAADNSRFLRVEATRISEAEITEVAFSGQFSTADGELISIDLHYSLQRSYTATTLAASVGGTAKDPLALNFDGRGVALDPGGTRFDLDSDNVIDTLPTLRTGSAYLALDRNSDGAINNGSELFGPTSGSGYAELAQWDEDGNGFIDAADSVFTRLLLFRPGETAETLASRDVGAIFLGSAASPARLTDSNNQSLGQLRATGFYLTNAGGAGLVQELDLVV